MLKNFPQPSPAPSGKIVAAVADCTPGSALTRVSSWSKKANPAGSRGSVIFCGIGYFASGSGTRMVNTLCAVKPTSTCRNLMKLRTMSPEPASSTSASATSAITNNRRIRPCLRLPIPLLPPSLSDSRTLPRAAWSAGKRPKIKIVSKASAKVKISTRLFTVIALPRGNEAGNNDESRSIPHIASNAPSNPPIKPSGRHSMITCRTMRARLAPRLARIANSFSRADARASSRLATLTQATSNTNATAPSNTSNALRESPVICSCIGTTRAPSPLLPGSCSSIRRAMALTSACACSRVTPGLSRPTRLIK